MLHGSKPHRFWGTHDRMNLSWKRLFCFSEVDKEQNSDLTMTNAMSPQQTLEKRKPQIGKRCLGYFSQDILRKLTRFQRFLVMLTFESSTQIDSAWCGSDHPIYNSNYIWFCSLPKLSPLYISCQELWPL